MNNYLVLDFGGTQLKYCFMNNRFNLSNVQQIDSPLKSLKEFREVVTKIIKENLDEIKGIAISFPGKIDEIEGTIVTGGAYKIMAKENIFHLIGELTSLPVSIVNDAKAAMLAEMETGSLEKANSGILMTIGTGIGGSIMINRQVISGDHENSGEFSAITVNSNEEITNRNCWAAQNITKILPKKLSEIKKQEIKTGKDFFKYVEEKDQDSLHVLDKYAEQMAIQIFNLQAVLDVDKIVIGGGISSQAILISTIRKKLDSIFELKKDFHVLKPELDACKFFNQANLIGALIHFKQQNNI